MVSTSLKPAYSFSRLKVSKTAGIMRSLFRSRKSIPLPARLSILSQLATFLPN
jgi:hypothetical protein